MTPARGRVGVGWLEAEMTIWLRHFTARQPRESSVRENPRRFRASAVGLPASRSLSTFHCRCRGVRGSRKKAPRKRNPARPRKAFGSARPAGRRGPTRAPSNRERNCCGNSATPERPSSDRMGDCWMSRRRSLGRFRREHFSPEQKKGRPLGRIFAV